PSANKTRLRVALVANRAGSASQLPLGRIAAGFDEDVRDHAARGFALAAPATFHLSTGWERKVGAELASRSQSHPQVKRHVRVIRSLQSYQLPLAPNRRP